MPEIKVDEKKQELKEKIRIYEKNNKALYNILTFYSHILEDKKELSTYLILDTIIKDLEDNEISIPLKAESIKILLEQDLEEYQDLNKIIYESEYEDLQICRDYRATSITSYYENKRDTKFDFIDQLCEYNMDFVSELLVSNIAINKRADYLYKTISFITKEYYNKKLEYLLNLTDEGCILSRIPVAEKNKKMKELLSYFKETLTIDKRIALLENLKKRFGLSALYWLYDLQEEYKIVEFLDLHGTYQCEEENLEISPYLYVSQIGCLEFYQYSVYLKVPERLRDNDDIVILSNLKLGDIFSFIQLTNFHLTDEKAVLIGKRVFAKQQEEGIIDKDLIEQIKCKIIDKSKNQKEYEENLKYANIFEKYADYGSYLEEQKRMVLEEARTNLLVRLNNMGESLLKQVSEETLIRSLDFYKKIDK